MKRYKNKFNPDSLFFDLITDKDVEGWKAGLKSKDIDKIVFKGLEDDKVYKEIHLLHSDSGDMIWGIANQKESDIPDFFVIDENLKVIQNFSNYTD